MKALVRKILRDNGWATRLPPQGSTWDLEAAKPKLFMAKKSRVLLVKVGGTPHIDDDVVRAMGAEIAKSPKVAMVGIYVLVDDDDARFAWVLPGRSHGWSGGDIPDSDFHTIAI